MLQFFAKIRRYLSSLADSFYSSVPKLDRVVHCGVKRKDDLRFKKILLVDDVPQYVLNSLRVVKKHYSAGEVVISMAYSYRNALDVFEKEKNDLVVLDLDLQDSEGDGSLLAEKFRQLRSDVVILANSKIQKYNDILMARGAVCSLGKKKDRLRNWLQENEPI